MIRQLRILTFLILTSNLLYAQETAEIQQFDKLLNQFLNVRDFCISENGEEAFFTVQSPGMNISQISSIKKEKGVWGQAELLPFCDSYMYLEPFLSHDGKRLYFVSDRPLHDTGSEKKDFDIWYVERNSEKGQWSEPINLENPVNSELDEFYPSISENNNLYFTMVSPKGLGKDDIYVCKWENGQYTAPLLLDESINSSGYEFNAFVSKKEDFLLFTKYNEKDGQGSGDLYISRKDKNGNWQKATNLGVPINSRFMEYCPFYDDENEILYFTSKRNDIKARNFEDITDFINYVREGANGLSKVYQYPIKL